MSVTVFPTPSTGGTAKSLTTTFITSTQAWVAPTGVTNIDILLVGAGGGGGGAAGTSHKGGGGGGGGVVSQSLPVTPGTSYTVTIGAGGAAGTASSTSPGGNGTASTFGTLSTAYGGGGGFPSGGTVPTSGLVSSGGGSGTSTAASSGSGGGAFPYQVENVASTATIRTNSAGAIAIVQGTFGFGPLPVTGYAFMGNPGLNGYGAGGGGAQSTANTLFGGLNAGAGAFQTTAATAATANYGGGGGAGIETSAVYYSASAGGSGVCIIKYWS